MMGMKEKKHLNEEVTDQTITHSAEIHALTSYMYIKKQIFCK